MGLYTTLVSPVSPGSPGGSIPIGFETPNVDEHAQSQIDEAIKQQFKSFRQEQRKTQERETSFDRRALSKSFPKPTRTETAQLIKTSQATIEKLSSHSPFTIFCKYAFKEIGSKLRLLGLLAGPFAVIWVALQAGPIFIAKKLKTMKENISKINKMEPIQLPEPSYLDKTAKKILKIRSSVITSIKSKFV